MNRQLMAYGVALLLLPPPLFAADVAPLTHRDSEVRIPASSRDDFYCQDPDYIMIYNMSSGFDAEIADDIPAEWEAFTVGAITLWLGEWYTGGSHGWVEPLGLRLNLYHEFCPPELDPYESMEFAWADLEKELVDSSGSRWVYEVRVPLSPPLVLEAGMSLGATALIDWGQEEPFCGIVATPFWVSYGACPAYLDGENWGYIRWTAIDEFTTINQDLAYCLEGYTTAAPAAVSGSGRLRVTPNPFNPRTTVDWTVAEPGPLTLRVHDVAGRIVATLFDGWYDKGELRAEWNGRDDTGRTVAVGVYFVTVESRDATASAKVVLLE